MKPRIVIALIFVFAVFFSFFGAASASDTPTIRILAFAQGFAWPELFGSKGTERTDLLKKLEDEVGVKILIEWGDETAVRQKVLTDLIAGTGRYDSLFGSAELYP